MVDIWAFAHIKSKIIICPAPERDPAAEGTRGGEGAAPRPPRKGRVVGNDSIQARRRQQSPDLNDSSCL